MPPLVPEVIPLLCQALVAWIAWAYVLSLPRKTRAARWLAVGFAGHGAFAASYLLGVLVGPSEAWAIRFNLALYGGVAVAAFASVRVAYTFLARPFRRDERLATAAFGGALTLLAGGTAWAAAVIDVHLFPPLLYGYGVYLVAAALWTLTVHLRQARRFRHLGGTSASRRARRRSGTVGHLTVAGLVALLLGLSVLNALSTFGALPYQAIQVGSLVAELVIIVGLVVVFINHAPEPTTVQAKVVGVTLGATLALLGLASLALLRPGEVAAAAGNAIPTETAVRFVPDGAGGYRARPSRAAFAAGPGRAEIVVTDDDGLWPQGVVALPFAFPIDGRTYREVAVSPVPYLAFGANHTCDRVCLGITAAPRSGHPLVLPFALSADFEASGWPDLFVAPGRLDVVWTLVGLGGERSEHRATLFSDGAVEIAYRGPARHPTAGAAGLYLGSAAEAAFAGGLPASVPAGEGLVDAYGARYAALAHERTVRMVPLVLGGAGFALVLLPLFLRRGVLRPLAALLDGVERVDRGERDVHVAPGANDELGTLTRRFNTMTASLGAAERRLRQYAGRLEERVTERTRELEGSLAELEAAQGRLVQAEKLASLGRLTSGIAHEIKNPLNFVLNFAGLALDAVDDLRGALAEGHGEAVDDLLDDLALDAERIERHAVRADRVVQAMQLHARGAAGDRVPSDLNALLRLAAEGVGRAYSGRTGGDALAPVELDLDPEVGTVAVVPEGVLQVASSLLDNALYATACASSADPVRLTSRRRRGEVVVRVEDAGTGMDEETAGRVFEPFFTTKPAGEGVGLGLSLAYDVVTAGHGGQVEVESEPGVGTAFTVRLPAEAAPRADGRCAVTAGAD